MKVHRTVFFSSAAIILLFVLLTAFNLESMDQIVSTIQDWIVTKAGWFYIISVTFFLGFVLWLFFSKFGQIKLGTDEDEPEYSYMSWFAMLFTAGMGIGLLFFSVSEPIAHFSAPPNAIEPETIGAARQA
ncbi:MAG: BCCT family transporter, partial [Verrucomicrobiota bacterium]